MQCDRLELSPPIARWLSEILLWFSPLYLGLARPERLIGCARQGPLGLAGWTLVDCVLVPLRSLESLHWGRYVSLKALADLLKTSVLKIDASKWRSKFHKAARGSKFANSPNGVYRFRRPRRVAKAHLASAT